MGEFVCLCVCVCVCLGDSVSMGLSETVCVGVAEYPSCIVELPYKTCMRMSRIDHSSGYNYCYALCENLVLVLRWLHRCYCWEPRQSHPFKIALGITKLLRTPSPPRSRLPSALLNCWEHLAPPVPQCRYLEPDPTSRRRNGRDLNSPNAKTEHPSNRRTSTSTRYAI